MLGHWEVEGVLFLRFARLGAGAHVSSTLGRLHTELGLSGFRVLLAKF